MSADELETVLVGRIRRGDSDAWQECIARYEGRLLAFVDSRLRDQAASEDVVQETFVGLLVSLPNYDPRTPLESFLFAIASHKLTDVLRRQGRRPVLPFAAGGSAGEADDIPGKMRMASSLARSGEQHAAEERALSEALQGLIRQWTERGDFERLKCVELLFVLGWPNNLVAERLGISEQAVANHKHFALSKLKEYVGKLPGISIGLSRLG